MEKPPGDRHISLHVPGIYKKLVDQGIETRKHVINENGAVGYDDPFD
jgi:hypothetical protein